MSEVETTLDDQALLALVSSGDTRRLTPAQKIAYYRARCEVAGLDPRTAPFQFLTLQGREILYALKSATDQLAAKHRIRCEVLDQRTEDGIRIVTVRATTADGRQTDEIGAVPVQGLKGDALCNALMKAVTKAKRRAVLAVCGLGMLDETEIETIHGAAPAPAPVVKMPTRLSARPRPALPAAEAEAAPADGEDAPPEPAEPEVSEDDDVEARREESVQPARAYATPGQIRMLHAVRRGSGHDEAAFRAWLQSRGIQSVSQIPRERVDEILMRLRDGTPLEVAGE